MSIRNAAIGDLPQILAVYAPYVETTCYSFEYETPSPDAFSRRFRDITAQFPWLVWEEDGRILGYAYASAPFARAAYRWCAEPSVYLLPEAQGRGIGKALYTALEERLTRQGYQVLYAIITSDNAHSLGFHQAMGYRHLASFPNCGFKHGAWHGITWMEKRLSFVETPSQFPVPFPEIVNSDRN